MVLALAAQLAISLFERGWHTLIIGGNSLFDSLTGSPTSPACARSQKSITSR